MSRKNNKREFFTRSQEAYKKINRFGVESVKCTMCTYINKTKQCERFFFVSIKAFRAPSFTFCVLHVYHFFLWQRKRLVLSAFQSCRVSEITAFYNWTERIVFSCNKLIVCLWEDPFFRYIRNLKESLQLWFLSSAAFQLSIYWFKIICSFCVPCKIIQSIIHPGVHDLTSSRAYCRGATPSRVESPVRNPTQ